MPSPAMKVLGRVVSSISRTLGWESTITVGEHEIALSAFIDTDERRTADIFAQTLIGNLKRVGFDHQEHDLTAFNEGWTMSLVISIY